MSIGHRPSLATGSAPRHAARAAVAMLASGTLYFFSIGFHPWWPGVWLAPLPVLLLAFTMPARWAAGAAFGAFLIGGCSVASFLAMLMPPAALAAILVLPAAVFAAAVVLARRLVLRASAVAAAAEGGDGARRAAAWGLGALAALALPAAWTAFAYLVSLTSPDGTAGNLAYTQVDFLPVLQLASLAGIWGITFALLLAPAGLAAAWALRRARLAAGGRGGAAAGALVATLGIVVPALAFGAVRLAQPAAPARLRVGLAATDATVRYFRTERPQEALRVIRWYAERVGELAARGAQVVVVPEKIVGVTPAYEAQVTALLAAAARDHHVMVIAGLNLIGRQPKRNVALVLGPDGRLLAEYDKVYMVPGLEIGYRTGSAPALLSLPVGTAGIAICKDMDFPAWLRGYAAAGHPGVLLVPAWDFVRDGRLHARMAVVRGVESGFSLARAAQEGLVTASDPYGRILAEAGSDPVALVVADVPLGPGSTFYSRHGDWLGILSVLLLAIALAAAVLAPRRAVR
jgi:apolipoprotein N-acyltransferase